MDAMKLTLVEPGSDLAKDRTATEKMASDGKAAGDIDAVFAAYRKSVEHAADMENIAAMLAQTGGDKGRMERATLLLQSESLRCMRDVAIAAIGLAKDVAAKQPAIDP